MIIFDVCIELNYKRRPPIHHCSGLESIKSSAMGSFAAAVLDLMRWMNEEDVRCAITALYMNDIESILVGWFEKGSNATKSNYIDWRVFDLRNNQGYSKSYLLVNQKYKKYKDYLGAIVGGKGKIYNIDWI